MLTLSYNSTHYYLIDCSGGKLLVDAGLPGTLPKFVSQLKKFQIAPAEIRYLLFTHHHPDHAGIIQELKELCHARLLIHAIQIPYLDELATLFARKGGYTSIQVEPNDVILQTPNRAVLQGLGIPGEVIETPGHSPDCISLVLDSGAAFIGDLSPYFDPQTKNGNLLQKSWQKMIDSGVQVFYPAHSDPIQVDKIRNLLI